MKNSNKNAKVLESGQNSSGIVGNFINLKAIKKDFLKFENFSIISSPPALCINTSFTENSSANKCSKLFLESTQDRELLDILEEFKNHEQCINEIRTSSTNDEQLKEHFRSDIVFNYNNRVLSENEIKVLVKCFD